MRQYQTALDSILERHPELQNCAVSCAHCGIRFLAHPRNAGRRNLRCPFGCRQCRRRQLGNQRSAAYYRTAEGRRAKKLLNNRRQCRPAPAPPVLVLPTPPASDPAPAEGPLTLVLPLGDVVLDEPGLARSPMLSYVGMLVRLIEGVALAPGEVIGLLRRSLRQRRLGARRKIDYLLGFLHQHPP